MYISIVVMMWYRIKLIPKKIMEKATTHQIQPRRLVHFLAPCLAALKNSKLKQNNRKDWVYEMGVS